jgi:CDGSH-type Zn-finger protein
MSEPVKITVRPNGPYLVQGEIELIDPTGARVACERAVALCRCGASSTKPFCDGTHKSIGFSSADAAASPAR